MWWNVFSQKEFIATDGYEGHGIGFFKAQIDMFLIRKGLEGDGEKPGELGW